MNLYTEPLLQRNGYDPMTPLPYRVRRVRRETYDTFTLEMEAAHSTGGFNFAPGQFNMLYAFGVGEVPISISGDPTQPEVLIHTIRAVGSVTRALQRLRQGYLLGVRGPFGSYWPVVAAEGCDVVVVAGGIGLAPLRPAIYAILARRVKYGRVVLLYGARTPRDLLYIAELERWRGKLSLAMDVRVSVDSAAPEWRGDVGFVTGLIARAQFDPANTVAMVCGPEVMMRFAALELTKRGMEQESIYLSTERNMKCGIGLCGHCQFGPTFVCKDGPVFRYDRVKALLAIREL